MSGIAQRIENRGVGLWAAVDAIFEANPEAFINNDINLIKLGSQLSIPSFGNGSSVIVDSAPAANSSAATQPVESSVVANEAQVTAGQLHVTTDDLQPGNVQTDDNPFVETPVAAEATSAETVVIPDTQLEGPSTDAVSPNVPTAGDHE